MDKVGIVGGIGPASTLDYYRGIVNGYRERTEEDRYPEIVICSINMTEMLSFVQKKDWDALTAMLVMAVKSLAGAGVSFAAIASNTPHIVFDRVQRESPLPLISIVDETGKYAQSTGCKKAVVIGTRFTMNSGFYAEGFEKYGIAAIVPTRGLQEDIHNLIFPRLENGIVVPEDKETMLGIVRGLIAEHQADSLVLGCTELPLMIQNDDLDTFLLNTTQIHIEAILNRLI
ncbi:MAG: amino acid racemase [Peptococcaceae bacterium]|nr:amino acid racemase [Peptococcaceae bacterium]